MTKSIRILIVDDHTVVRDGLEALLSAEPGMEVVGTGGDGEQAIELAGALNPDIILLDLVMPGMDGFTVLEKVRAQPHSVQWQPVIIVSAKEELEDMKKGFALEADHYITKPCQMDDILHAIRLMMKLLPHRKTSFDIDV